MDFSGPAITYILLIIPTLFALVVIAQGVSKMVKHEYGGGAGVGFGITFLLLIGAAYFFFIR